MSTDLKAIMLRDERRRQMLNDPDLTGDLLLLALAMDEIIAVRKEQGRKRFQGGWVAAVEEMVCRKYAGRIQGWWVKERIGSDIPRYEPEDKPGRGCVAPMVRRDGECGKPGTTSLVDRDPITGKGRRVYLCGRHKDLVGKFRARQQEWVRNGKPSPPPNAGGVLERYYTWDWDAAYRWAKPWRESLEGGREATPPRPKLRLIQGGDVDDEELES